jgi:hypothetical protein
VCSSDLVIFPTRGRLIERERRLAAGGFVIRRSVMLIAAGIASLGAFSPAFAQDTAPKAQASSQTAAPTEKKDSPAAKPEQKPKKVWTNDDMADLHANSTVSVVGNRNKNPQQTYYPPAGQTDYYVKMYRQQIDQLQARVDGIDKQIANLQDAKNGKTVDSSRTYDPWGGKQGDWNSQIDQLQKSRENILQQIDSLESQIRKLNP